MRTHQISDYHKIGRHAPWEVFKYLPASYCADVLTKRELRITQREALNDPFELAPTPAMLEVSTTHVPTKSAYDAPIRDDGVLSFSMIPDSVPMWTYYADSHKGIVVGFDGDHDFFEGLQAVRYLRTRPNDCPDMSELAFFKSDQWIYEREVRLIRQRKEHATKYYRSENGRLTEQPIVLEQPSLDPSGPGDFYMVEVAPTAISSVVFGTHTSTRTRMSVLSAIENSDLSHVTRFQADRKTDSWDIQLRRYSEFDDTDVLYARAGQ